MPLSFIILDSDGHSWKEKNAKTLLEWGFLDKIVPSKNVMQEAMEMAEAYAAQAPVAAQMVKRSINAIMSAHDQAFMHMDSDQVWLAQKSIDFNEDVQAFFQKRTPKFKGE